MSDTPQHERRMERRARERDEFETRLKADYLPGLPDAVTALVFDKAWEDGHASGVHEVEARYDELVDIAKAAFEAGLKAGAQQR